MLLVHLASSDYPGSFQIARPLVYVPAVVDARLTGIDVELDLREVVRFVCFVKLSQQHAVVCQRLEVLRFKHLRPVAQAA